VQKKSLSVGPAAQKVSQSLIPCGAKSSFSFTHTCISLILVIAASH
jgi:hypothetical protein